MKFIVSFLFALSFSFISEAKPGKVIPGKFIVEIQEEEDPEQVARSHGLTPDHVYSRVLKGFAGKMSEAAHTGLLKDKRVKKVEHDRVVEANLLQSSPTWGLDRIDQRNLPLNSAYNYNYAGSGVTVFVIDTGIRYDHAEFSGRAVFGFDAFGGNGSDCNGHGTHVAGTIGGRTYGVAKNTRLVAVKVLDCNGSGSTSTVLAGLDWVNRNHSGPSVANLSLGGGASTSMDTAMSNLINSGVTAIVAAGNENQNACNVSPARVTAAITVGASSSSDYRASFSNYGSCVDFFAPGVNIMSAAHLSSTGIVGMSGTSMAAPHAAGAAALILERSPTASPQSVRDALYNSSSKGVVQNSASTNNHLLYTLESTATAPVTDTTPPSTSVTSPTNGAYVSRNSYVTISATAIDNVRVSKVEFFVNGYLRCTDSTAPYSCTWRTPNTNGTSYQLRTRATDSSGNTGLSAINYVRTR